MQAAIDALNQMQTAFQLLGEQCPIQLPELVVVGNQSAGKSSVLEAIIKQEFLPRGTQMVTRCPIILQLIPVTDATPRPSGLDESATEWATLSMEKEPQLTFDDFNLLGIEIKRYSERIAASGALISDKPVSVDIYATDILPLRLVDLPGMISFSKDKPKATEQIRTMCKNYVSKENVIIVAVSSASDDVNNSMALGLAREVDPEGNRTIAVFTKLDLAKTSTKYTAESLQNQTGMTAKLGIICVINRTQDELDSGKTFQESIQTERKFFAANHPDIADKHGTPYLEHRLCEILRNHMLLRFPTLLSEIRILIEKNQEALGKMIKSPKGDERGRVMARFVKLYETAYMKTLKGAVDSKRLRAGAKIRRLLQDTLIAELESIPAIDPEWTDDRIRTVIENCAGTEVQLTRFNAEALIHMIKKRIRAFDHAAKSCAKQVYTELVSETTGCFEISEELQECLKQFPVIRNRFIEVTKQILLKRRDLLYEKIADLFHQEIACVNFGHADFLPEAQRLLLEAEKSPIAIPDPKKTPAKPATPADLIEQEVNMQKKLLELYFGIIRKTMKDSLVKTIFTVLISFTEEKLGETLFAIMMQASSSDELWEQQDYVDNKRQHIEDTVDMLLKTEKALQSIIS